MRSTVRLARAACVLLTLLALAAPRPTAAAGVHASLQPSVASVPANGLVTVKLTIFQADAAFNAFDAYIQYDNTRLAFVSGSNQADSLPVAACANRFQIFRNNAAQPADPDTLELHFTLLCAGATMVGPGALYRVQFRALANPPPGIAPISLVDETAFFNEGLNVTPIELRNTSVLVGCPAITLSPPSLPPGAVGAFYGQTIVASGGAGPYTFSVSSGALPDGLTLAADGTLSGTPTAAGSSNFAVTATDVSGCSGTLALSLTVCGTIAISPETLPHGLPGSSYSQTLVAGGGIAPYTFSLESGSAPPGMMLAASGLLAGTPEVAGTFDFVVRATDAIGCFATRAYTLVIDCHPIAITPTTLPTGTVHLAYQQSLGASGGIPPYAFTTPGGLPSGLTLSSDGVVSGTPDATGTSIFDVTATDVTGCAGTVQDTVVIIGVLGAGDAAMVRDLSFESPRPNPRVGLAALRLRFALPAAARVGFELVDPAGRVVARRAGESFAAGRHESTWNLPALPTGMYFLTFTADGRVAARSRWVILR